jgi:hypothetical protein
LQTHRSASRHPVPSSAGRCKPPQPRNRGSSSRALGASAGRRWLGRWEKAGEKVGRVSALLLQLPFHTYLRTICRDLPPGGRSGRPLELATRTTSSARGYGFLARSVFLVSTSTKWLRSTRLDLGIDSICDKAKWLVEQHKFCAVLCPPKGPGKLRTCV